MTKDIIFKWLSYAKKLGKEIFNFLDTIKKAISIYLVVLKPMVRLLLQIVPPVLTLCYNEVLQAVFENWII